MPIHPLPVITEEEEAEAIEKLRPPKTVVVRYGYMKLIGEFPYAGEHILGCGTKLVVRTPRGIELGEMLTTTCANAGCGKSVSRKQMLQYIENSGGKQYPFTTEGEVVRAATPEDRAESSRLEDQKPAYIKAAKAAIREMELPMRLVEVEPLLDGRRVIFYYLAEERVDFRELVRRLSRELNRRIEMCQVGARDEARLVADYEKCGQHCCCKQFLKVLKPVPMRAAKVQKGTLDPSKISGRCGRLMCCLRYEDQTYEQLRKNLPHRRARVMTDDGPGTVISTQILTQLALVQLDDPNERNAYPVEHIEILAGDRARPRDPDDLKGGKSRPRGNRGEPRHPRPGQPLMDGEVESREGEQ